MPRDPFGSGPHRMRRSGGAPEEALLGPVGDDVIARPSQQVETGTLSGLGALYCSFVAPTEGGDMLRVPDGEGESWCWPDVMPDLPSLKTPGLQSIGPPLSPSKGLERNDVGYGASRSTSLLSIADLPLQSPEAAQRLERRTRSETPHRRRQTALPKPPPGRPAARAQAIVQVADGLPAQQQQPRQLGQEHRFMNAFPWNQLDDVGST